MIDASAVTVEGEGLSLAAVNQRSSFVVKTQGAGTVAGGEAGLAVSLTDPIGRELPVDIRGGVSLRSYSVEYCTRQTGEKQL